MNTRRGRAAALRGAAVVVAAAALLGGCGRADAGAGPPNPFPPRPVDLRVTAVRACDAVDQAGATALGIVDRIPDPLGQGANNCVLSGAGGQVWTVRVQPGIPARRYVPGQPGFLGEKERFVGQQLRTVDGYGAVENTNKVAASNYTCTLVVDADPDASFMVGYEVNSPQARSRTVGSRAQGCAQATRVASMLIATARARP